MRTALVAIVVAALTDACGKTESTPVGPSPMVGPLSGVWTGTVSRTGISQPVRLTLTETRFGGIVINGTYTIGEGAGVATGTVGGAFPNARDVILTLTPTTPLSCPQPQVFPAGQITLELVLDGNRMSGPANFALCADGARGTATFTR